jgi:hypothetical protein
MDNTTVCCLHPLNLQLLFLTDHAQLLIFGFPCEAVLAPRLYHNWTYQVESGDGIA